MNLLRAPSPWSSSTLAHGGRGGWVILEFIVAALLVALLVGLASPQIEQVRNRRIAAAIVRDVSTLRDAAARYMVDEGVWPPSSSQRTGRGVSTYLPSTFSFDGEGYQIAWERWDLPDGLPPGTEPRVLVGVTIRTEIPGMARSLQRIFGEKTPRISVGTEHTFIFEGL